MTEQELFDKVALHLLTQGERSAEETRGGESCKYRGPNGLKCAAGALILDEFYLPSIENQGVRKHGPWQALLKSGVPMDSRQLVASLQVIHDGTDPEYWPGALQHVANVYALSARTVIDFQRAKGAWK